MAPYMWLTGCHCPLLADKNSTVYYFQQLMLLPHLLVLLLSHPQVQEEEEKQYAVGVREAECHRVLVLECEVYACCRAWFSCPKKNGGNGLEIPSVHILLS